jgi:hypothetical protein
MPLTVLQIAALQPLDKSYRKADEKGLYWVPGTWCNYRRPCAYLAALTGRLHLARAMSVTMDRAHIR